MEQRNESIRDEGSSYITEDTVSSQNSGNQAVDKQAIESFCQIHPTCIVKTVTLTTTEMLLEKKADIRARCVINVSSLKVSSRGML